jgi:hypothetical protein
VTDASQRPSRVLAGWLDEESSRALGLDDGAARKCREAVRCRSHDRLLTQVEFSPAPLGRVSRNLSDVDPRFRKGELEVVAVDLAHVVATQSVVAVDELRVNTLASHPTLEEVAIVTLPIAPLVLPTTAFDERAQAWVVRSRGASIAVTGRYVAAAESGDPGSQCFGFLVSAQPSRITVGVIQGRVVLLDGHHRAVALLALGVRRAPVALDRASSLPLTTDSFGREVILGQSPPLLCDYLDGEVSLEAVVARTERVILISATEVDLPD